MATPPEPVLPLVREEVKRLLVGTPAFRALPEAQRREIANNVVRIADYIVAGAQGDSTPGSALVATEQAGPPPRPPTASGDLKQSGAAAAQTGGAALADLVNKVDFPKFVAGLIDGVFNAIVNASIKQMEAFAELVKNVAKSVDDFMKDNVSENQARDYLVDKYPDHLEIDAAGGAPQVRTRPSADAASMPDFFADLGLPSQAGSVDDAALEEQLVPAARKRLAMDRQQMLATMVLMGINRIVVTDGSIKASVLFDLSTRDAVQRAHNQQQTATFHETSKYQRRPGFFGWFSGYSTFDRNTDFTVQTVTNDKDESQASVDMKAKLAGEVNVRFRSETFPLEKMSELIAPDMRDKVQGRLPQRAPTAAPGPAPAPPPAPVLPGPGALPVAGR
jgi:hypothetical protein